MTVARVFGPAMHSFLNKEVGWAADTVKMALCDSNYWPDQDTDRYLDSLAGELSGGGYARVTLTGKTIAYNATTNALTLSCDDALFPALTTSDVSFAVIFVDTGVAGTSPLIAWIDFEGPQELVSQDLRVVIPATGLIALTAA